jgi:hypothetical protein
MKAGNMAMTGYATYDEALAAANMIKDDVVIAAIHERLWDGCTEAMAYVLLPSRHYEPRGMGLEVIR